MKRNSQSFVLFLCLSHWAAAQQWAVKSLPLVLPIAKSVTVIAPLAVEYTFSNRSAIQICPAFFKTQYIYGYGIGRSPGSLSSYAKVNRNLFANHYHLNVSTRRYLGDTPFQRAWFFGINAWMSFEKFAFAIPNAQSIWYSEGTNSELRGIGGFIGKNIALGRHWFVESKLCFDRVSIYVDTFWQFGDDGFSAAYIDQRTHLRPTILIGYRW